MPVPGSVVHLVTAYSGAGHRASVDEVGRDVHWVSGSGSGRKRIRLNRKTRYLAFLSFYWCVDEVSLLVAWWAS